jgi:hypothetical protein
MSAESITHTCESEHIEPIITKRQGFDGRGRDARKRIAIDGDGSALAIIAIWPCLFLCPYTLHATYLRLQPLPPEMKRQEANAEADGRLILQSTTALGPL